MENQAKQNTADILKKTSGILIRAAIISLGILLVWSGWLVMASEYASKIGFNLFGITQQEFITLNLIGLLIFKIICTVFFLIPFISIKIYEKQM